MAVTITSFLLDYFCPILGTVLTVLFYASVLPTVNRIVKTGILAGYDPYPTVISLNSAVSWFLYGLLLHSWPLYISSGCGMFVMLYSNITCHPYFSPRIRQKLERSLLGVVFYQVCIGLFFMIRGYKDKDFMNVIFGIFSNTSTICLYLFPLCNIFTIIKTKNSSSIIFSWTILQLVNNCIWVGIGIGINSMFLIMCSMIGIVTAVLMLALKLCYPITPNLSHTQMEDTVTHKQKEEDISMMIPLKDLNSHTSSSDLPNANIIESDTTTTTTMTTTITTRTIDPLYPIPMDMKYQDLYGYGDLESGDSNDAIEKITIQTTLDGENVIENIKIGEEEIKLDKEQNIISIHHDKREQNIQSGIYNNYNNNHNENEPLISRKNSTVEQFLEKLEEIGTQMFMRPLSESELQESEKERDIMEAYRLLNENLGVPGKEILESVQNQAAYQHEKNLNDINEENNENTNTNDDALTAAAIVSLTAAINNPIIQTSLLDMEDEKNNRSAPIDMATVTTTTTATTITKKIDNDNEKADYEVMRVNRPLFTTTTILERIPSTATSFELAFPILNDKYNQDMMRYHYNRKRLFFKHHQSHHKHPQVELPSSSLSLSLEQKPIIENSAVQNQGEDKQQKPPETLTQFLEAVDYKKNV